MSAVLELVNVGRTYRGAAGEVRAVENVSLSLPAGRMTAVVGPSGCGKSTLLLCAGGLLQPTAGRVSIEGKNPYELTGDARARLRAEVIGFVFQQFHLVPYLSVRDNIVSPALGLPSTDPRESLQRADELIERLGLTSRRDHVPAALSSGERQRTALARALFNRPRLLLADEPTGNLDTENGDIVLAHLRDFATEGGAVLLVTHDPEAVTRADESIRLRDGKLVPLASEE